MKSIAIIPARGGSKRIPRKNIKEFCGQPIIKYSIDAALECSCFDEVMVSTDDEEIACIARKYGAKVPFMRSPESSNDMAVTRDVLIEVLQCYEDRGVKFENLCCLYPTAPFVTSRKLEDAMNLLFEENANVVFPVTQFSFPPQRGVVIDNGYVKMQFPENLLVRSQDLEPVYHDCGQFYCINVEDFMREKQILMDKSMGIILPGLEVQDIDNEEDWTIAEMKYKLMKKAHAAT